MFNRNSQGLNSQGVNYQEDFKHIKEPAVQKHRKECERFREELKEPSRICSLYHYTTKNYHEGY